MKNQNEEMQNHGKILDHDAGIGEVSADEITRRAQELAMIAGRLPDKFNEADRRQAGEELRGHRDPLQAEDEPPFAAEMTERDDTLGTGGATNPADSPEEDGDRTVGETLYSEGVDEAVHDQMLQSRRGELIDQAREDDSAR